MDVIADILLISGALGAALYCAVLSRRLRRFTDLEKGVGGAVAVLSAQVDDMTKALKAAQGSAATTSGTLDGLTSRAEDAARRLELLVASLHDLPEVPYAATVPARQDNPVVANSVADAPIVPATPSPADLPVAEPSEAKKTPPEEPASTLFLSGRARIRETSS